MTPSCATYCIPPTNPFVGNATFHPEIWASGLRNPWRFSFDRSTGDLYIADVGQNLCEEINFQPAASPGGENYGWSIMDAERFDVERAVARSTCFFFPCQSMVLKKKGGLI